MTNIEKKLKRLEEILKIFPDNSFHTVSASIYTVAMVGEYTDDVERIALDNGFVTNSYDEEKKLLWLEKGIKPYVENIFLFK